MSSSSFSYLAKSLKHLPQISLQEISDPKQYEREVIIKSYLRYISFLARRYTRDAAFLDDLMNEGVSGLLDAIERFDPTRAEGKPAAFRQLAIVRIKGFMYKQAVKHIRPYSVTSQMGRLLIKVEALRHFLKQISEDLDSESIIRLFSCEEEEKISAPIRKRIQELKEEILKAATDLKRIDGSNAEIYETAVEAALDLDHGFLTTMQTLAEDQDDSFLEELEKTEFLTKTLERLRPSAKEVIVSLLHGDTLQDAGKKIGVTTERARQIRDRTVEFIKRTRMYRQFH